MYSMLTLFRPMSAKFCWTYPQQLSHKWFNSCWFASSWMVHHLWLQYKSIFFASCPLTLQEDQSNSYVAILAFKTNHCGCREFLVFRCFVSWWIRLAHFWGLPLACHQFSYDEFRPCDEILRLDGFFCFNRNVSKGPFFFGRLFLVAGANQQNHHTSMMMT